MPSYRFVVTGRVQGVGFRYSTQRKAQQLGIKGWVANRADGAVEGVASGGAMPLGRFQTWLGDGPPGAQVFTLDWKPSDEIVDDGFFVKRL